MSIRKSSKTFLRFGVKNYWSSIFCKETRKQVIMQEQTDLTKDEQIEKIFYY